MAVYTRLTGEHFKTLLDRYALGEFISAQEIAEGVENSNYLLCTQCPGEEERRTILTLFEKRVCSDDLPFFLGLTEHLALRGIPCPRPLRTVDGKNCTEIAGKHAAIVTFLEGKSPRSISPQHLLSLGAMQARMHLAAEDFSLKRENTLSLAGWEALVHEIGADADTIAPGMYAALQKEVNYLAQHWPRSLPGSVIHADLFPDNVFYQGEEVSGVIDFYFACNDLCMYDLVITLNAWCFERDGSFNLTKARALLTAYHRVRRLRDAERAALPVLARGAALRFLLTRAFDWIHRAPDALVTPKDPMEYWRKLCFHQQVKEADEYGL